MKSSITIAVSSVCNNEILTDRLNKIQLRTVWCSINFYFCSKQTMNVFFHSTFAWICVDFSNLKFLDLKSSSEQIFSRKLSLGAPDSKPLHNKSRCLNTVRSFLAFKVISTWIFVYLKKALLWNFGKTPSSPQRFCSALYSPPSAVNITW